MWCERGARRTDGNEKCSKLGGSQEKKERDIRENHSKGKTKAGMYVEVDGWIVQRKYRESRAE